MTFERFFYHLNSLTSGPDGYYSTPLAPLAIYVSHPHMRHHQRYPFLKILALVHSTCKVVAGVSEDLCMVSFSCILACRKGGEPNFN